ncbi:efflux RND transporter permease subunit [Alloacidobacterium dinghuense]|uniref:Efflux RND transporter permease subunit n=1 Tax=Alloacidobacterium dinghuense TaxID=2763107 RepID=A0A7G8BHE0_9BACT|nr:efflux RND transporter permease subunit [Alloacidobacterium dinghuense]QNI31960.1 efflux RND transporter permease subunit [Alloacidobacterium dinghuense]
MSHKSEAEYIARTNNTARFFVEQRQLSLILLIAVCLWGWYGYEHMPKRKDPSIPVRVAVASTSWPGATAQEVEQLVTRPVEQTMAQNPFLKPPAPSEFGIRSISFPGLSLVYVQLEDSVTDTKKQFSDINLKLNALNNRLPQGAGPIQFNSDFGDTAALMLTVASPPASETEVALRAESIRKAILTTRSEESPKPPQPRVSIIYAFPLTVSASLVRDSFRSILESAVPGKQIADPHFFEGSGFVGVDIASSLSDEDLRSLGKKVAMEKLHSSEIHPDAWPAVFIRDPNETQTKLAAVAGDKYSYRDLDNFTDLIGRTLQGAAEVAKIDRKGVLQEQIYLDYSQEQLAQYGMTPSNLKDILGARNITLPGGQLEVGPKTILIDPSGKFTGAQQIGDVIIGTSSSASHSPVYLRDLVDISRGYQSPAKYLNYLTWVDKGGQWHRSRAVTLAVQVKDDQQIAAFGDSVDGKLASVRQYMPDDLIIARTSDQPLQVKENIALFMDSLYEAVALVVLVSWLGFWEWRSAVLMAICIPITLAMTFGTLYLMGEDIQQVSVATLIIALGLLVDDPVIAGDSIKRTLAEGHPNIIAAWLGPTKLATAIMYATITNIVAYLPFLMLTGSTGEFLHSLPIVMTVSLISSRLVSMTFLPLLGYYLLRPERKIEKSLKERRKSGFYGYYTRIAMYSIEHRWKFFLASLVFLATGLLIFSRLKTTFFPEDVQYWSYIDVWLPNDANLTTTNQTALKVEQLVREQAARFSAEHSHNSGKPEDVLRYITTFVGGGGPRFWFSASPQAQQLNYAQVLIEVKDKETTPEFIKELQPVLSATIPGARMDARQLLTNPMDYPIEIRISSTADVDAQQEPKDIRGLRAIADKVKDIFRSIPIAERTRDEWDQDSAQIVYTIDPDRANLAGVTNMDVANSSTAGISGTTVAVLQEGQKQIPVVARLRMQERAQLSDIQSLYVYASQDNNKIPLVQISSVGHDLMTGRIIRLEQFRTINVRSFPVAGHLSSEVLREAMPRLRELEASLPAGYRIQIGGEFDKTKTGFRNMALVMGISIAAVFLALAFQFKNAIKPLLVLAAAPYGMIGAFAALWIMHEPFGFMAFLGVASLVGVIVSHSIVLFDFIEERHIEGDDFELALIDAGILRLRPVLITVFATVLALVPLAMHGGPLWKPLCYAQIGGLLVATIVTKLQVPVMYAIFVLDLKILRWEAAQAKPDIAVAGANPVSPHLSTRGIE